MRKFKLKICKECNKLYIPAYNNQKQCSEECRISADRRRKRERQRKKRNSFHKIHVCRYCGQEFIATTASMYCSDICRKLAQIKRAKNYKIQKQKAIQ